MPGRLSVAFMPVVVLAVTLQARTPAAQSDEGRNGKIWDGVYTAAQAERGKDRFTGLCRRCHNDDLNGSERGPALRGEAFMRNWEAQNLSRLFTKIRDGMPPDSPGNLADEEYLDLIAHILRANTYPAGGADLKLETLEGIYIARKPGEGPREAPNFSVVQVVGCLMQGPDNVWMLTHATEPVLTTDQPSSEQALNNAEAQPLGPNTFRLVNVNSFGPESQRGHRMEAKGLVYRAPNKDRVNLISLRTLGSSCGN